MRSQGNLKCLQPGCDLRVVLRVVMRLLIRLIMRGLFRFHSGLDGHGVVVMMAGENRPPDLTHETHLGTHPAKCASRLARKDALFVFIKTKIAILTTPDYTEALITLQTRSEPWALSRSGK